MNGATQQRLLQSATTPSKGGLALALALATVGSGQGAEVDLSAVSQQAVTALFSESNSRFVVSVKPEDVAAYEKLFEGLPLTPIGRVTAGKTLAIQGLATLDRETMRIAFKETLAGI